MQVNRQCQLEGEFRITVFDPSGNLKSDSGPLRNFITQTGLTYPSEIAFADCFRYISLGTSSAANSICSNINNGWGTTGLTSPLPGYTYIGSRTAYSTTSSTLYDLSQCGFKEQNNILILSRGWKLPPFTTATTINEFMVSPGQPKVIGYNAGATAPASICYDSTLASAFSLPSIYESDGVTPLYGKEASYLGYYYQSPTICDCYFAFSRILYNPTVGANDTMNINYSLSIIFNTGAQSFGITPINNIGGASQWGQWNATSGVFGLSSLVHHGLKIINGWFSSSSVPFNGTGPLSPDNANQIWQLDGNYQVGYEWGESLVGYWGAPLEPTCPPINLLGYLATDNLEFVVNGSGGGNMPPFYAGLTPPANPKNYPLNQASGLMQWRQTPTSDVTAGTIISANWPGGPNDLSPSPLFDIRKYTVSSTDNNPIYLENWPSLQDYTSSINPSSVDGITNAAAIVQFLPSNAVQHNPFTTSKPVNRQMGSTYIFQFTNPGGPNDPVVGVTFNGQPVRAVVLSYFNEQSTNNPSFYWIPFLDTMLAPQLPNLSPHLLPSTINTTSPPTYATGSQFNYYYLENFRTLVFTFNMFWSSPCDPSVNGCAGGPSC